jgi:hypothetical protein
MANANVLEPLSECCYRPQTEGFPAISRGLSGATPPVSVRYLLHEPGGFAAIRFGYAYVLVAIAICHCAVARSRESFSQSKILTRAAP